MKEKDRMTETDKQRDTKREMTFGVILDPAQAEHLEGGAPLSRRGLEGGKGPGEGGAFGREKETADENTPHSLSSGWWYMKRDSQL